MNKVFLIKERTLRRLRRKIVVDPKFYDRNETESEIAFTRKPEIEKRGNSHPWQIVYSDLVSADGAPEVMMEGGYLTTQAASGAINQQWVPGLRLVYTPDQPLIYLKITRDLSTRAVTSAAITTEPTAASTTVTTVILGVWEAGKATQRQFQDVNIYETMMVSNGVFVWVPVAMNGTDVVVI